MSSDSNKPGPRPNKGRDGKSPPDEASSMDRKIHKMSGIWTASIDSLASDLNADVEDPSSLSGSPPSARPGAIGSPRNWKEEFLSRQSTPVPQPEQEQGSVFDDDDDPPGASDRPADRSADRSAGADVDSDLIAGPGAHADPNAASDEESALVESLWPREGVDGGSSSQGLDLPRKATLSAPDSIWSDDLPENAPLARSGSTAETQDARDERTPDESPRDDASLGAANALYDDEPPSRDWPSGVHGVHDTDEAHDSGELNASYDVDDGSGPPPEEPDSDTTYTGSDANVWAGMSRDEDHRPAKPLRPVDDDDDFKPGVHKMSGLWTASIDSVARDLFQQSPLDHGTSLDLAGAGPGYMPQSLATKSDNAGFSTSHVFGDGGEGPSDDPNLHPSNIFAFDDGAPTQMASTAPADPNAPPVPIIQAPGVTSFVSALGASHVFAESRATDPSSIGGSHVFAESRASDVKTVGEKEGRDYGEPPSVSAEMLTGSQLKRMLSQSRLNEPSQVTDPPPHVLDPLAKSKKTDDSLRPAKGVDTSHVFGSKLGKGTKVDEKKKSVRRSGSKVRGGGSDPNSRSKLLVKVRTINVAGEGSGSSTAPPDYELLEVLGEGGMGVVYLARQTAIDRYLAVKMLKPEKAQDAGVRARFLAEATATADLDHPNIVPVHELGRTANGALFYSMKRVQGTPWSQVVSVRTLTENLETLLRMADAVAFAHSRGVIHRDLKPENVMLGEYGEVLVMDWGLAISYLESGKAFRAERTESMAGSPSYMAPEMASEGAHRLGPASDVYLLGATLFELMTGTPPHTGRTLQQCLVAAARNIIVPSEVKGELMDIAMQAMATDPAERFQTVQEFQSAVRDYEAHSESIKLADKAQRLLQEARETGAYDSYAKAVFTFRESVEQWSGNDEARVGLAEATVDYAATAYDKGDLDLAGSLLNPEDPNHIDLLVAVQSAAEERIDRQRVLKRVTYGVWTLVVGGLIAATIFLIVIRQERDKALLAQANEATQRVAAEKNATDARNQKDRAEKNAAEAKSQKELAEKNAEEAKSQKELAEKNATEALAQQALAKKNEAEALAERSKAELAKDAEAAQRKIAEYNAYVATVGLAQASLQKNGFRVAEEKLKEFQGSDRAGWEWGRLMYLCHLEEESFADAQKQPLHTAVFSPDEAFVLVAGYGPARLWERSSGNKVAEFGGKDNVSAACFSPDGKVIAGAIGSKIVLFNRATGDRLGELKGHSSDVTCLAFADDGRRLLAGDAGGAAILWNVAAPLGLEAGREAAKGEDLIVQRYQGGHSVPIRCVAFSPGGASTDERVVTAGDDGRVICWHATRDLVVDGQPVPRVPRVFSGHKGPVYAAAFLPDGSQIVSAGADGQILFWSDGPTSADLKVQKRFAHDGAVRSLAVSKDGRSLVTGGDDNLVEIWNIERGVLVGAPLRGLGGAASAVQISRDQNSVLAASDAGECKLWDRAKYAETVEFKADAAAIASLDFSADEKQFAAGEANGSVRVWTVGSHESISLSEGGEGLTMSLAVSPDGTKTATGSEDGAVRIWDAKTGAELLQLVGHVGKVRGLAFSPDGATLASSGADGQVRCWNAADGKPLTTFSNGQSECFGLAFSPDGKHIAVGLANSLIRIWNRETGASDRDVSGHGRGPVWRVEYLDAERIVSTGSDGSAAIWSAATGEEMKSLRHGYAYVTALDVSAARDRFATGSERLATLWDSAGQSLAEFAHPDTVKSVAISADGSQLVTSCGDNIIRVWNTSGGPAVWEYRVRGGACVAAIPTADARSIVVGEGPWVLVLDSETHSPRMRLGRHEGIAGAAYRPGRNEMISAGRRDGAIKVWDLATQRVVRRFGAWRANGLPVGLNDVSVSADGTHVVAAGDDGKARVYAIETGEALAELPVGEPVLTVSFSPDEKASFVATGSKGGKVRLWSRAEGRLLAELIGHTDAVESARFSHDGRFLATAGREGVAFVWAMPSGLEAAGEKPFDVQPAAKLLGHKGAVETAVFSPDGLRVVTGGDDNDVKVWDAASGLELLTLEGHSSPVDALAFTADGRELISGSTAGRVLLWPSAPWKQPQPAAATAATNSPAPR